MRKKTKQQKERQLSWKESRGNVPPSPTKQKEGEGTSSYQAWFFSFLSSFVAQVARVFALLVFDLRPSVNSSWIIGLDSTNFSTSFPKAVHKSLCKINTSNRIPSIHLLFFSNHTQQCSGIFLAKLSRIIPSGAQDTMRCQRD